MTNILKTLSLLWVSFGAAYVSAGQETDGQPINKERIFQTFAEAYAVVYIAPYENRRDSVGIPAEAYKDLDELVKAHWKVLLSDIERLPVSPVHTSKAAVAVAITEPCESLPPLEYLDLLDRMLDLTEQGKLPPGASDERLMGTGEKNCFIAVNFEHPRVEKILRRAKRMSSDESMSAFFDECIEGTVAENYELVRTEDGRVLPETLPGIKRKREQDTLLRKIERLTGKKFPGDPELDPRTERPEENGVPGTAEVSDSGTSGWRQILVAGIIAIAAAFGIWKYRKVKTAVR